MTKQTPHPSLRTPSPRRTGRGMGRGALRLKKSLHRIGSHDFDALDVHAFHRHIARTGLRGPDLLEHVVALDQFAERSVLTVEETRVAVADEKLRAGGIGIAGARHGKHAAGDRKSTRLNSSHSQISYAVFCLKKKKKQKRTTNKSRP